MSQVLMFTTECQADDCDGTAKHGVLDITHDGDGSPIEIDLDMTCSQIVLTCETCGLRHFTGDIEILNEDEI